MKRLFKISAFSLLLIFTACSEGEMKVYEDEKAMVEDSKAKVEYVTADDLKEAIENEEKHYIVDCREENEYDSASIPGAINVPRGLAEFKMSSAVPERRAKVYVYCSNGDRSTLLASVLPEMKFSNVVVLEGGFNNWKEKFPEMIELEHHGAAKETHAAAPSGGCGG